MWAKVRQVQALEFWDVWECRSNPELGPVITTKLAYSKAGAYIGEADGSIASVLGPHGIKPELRTPESTVCSIGFSEREQKWYGWSHRAIFGFAVGDTVKAGDSTDESLPVGFRAKSLDDARKMAIAFAASVS